MLPYTGEGKGMRVCAMDKEGLLRSGPPPLIKTVDGDQTTPLFECLAEGRLRGDGLGPRIDGVVAGLRVLCLERN